MNLSDVVGNAGLGSFAEWALLLFFAAFVGIVIYVFVRKRSTWDAVRRLPLEDDRPGADPGPGSETGPSSRDSRFSRHQEAGR